MKQTAVGFLENAIYKYIDYVEGSHKAEPFTITQLSEAVEQAKEMEKNQLKDAYQHGRDDENCALSDGMMAPDYDNADEWYKGEYGGEQ